MELMAHCPWPGRMAHGPGHGLAQSNGLAVGLAHADGLAHAVGLAHAQVGLRLAQTEIGLGLV